MYASVRLVKAVGMEAGMASLSGGKVLPAPCSCLALFVVEHIHFTVSFRGIQPPGENFGLFW